MRLILHIGGAKCGSTAIQGSLRDNTDRLAKERGILIPGTTLEPTENVTGEQIFFFERMRTDKEQGLIAVTNRLRRLQSYMRERDLHTLIISAENLVNPGGFEEFFIEAQAYFDIEVILYIRRQDQYFVSAWQQWHLKTFPSLQDYVDTRLGWDANWNQLITPWEQALGAEKITLRRFRRNLLVNQDIASDFFQTMRLGDIYENAAGKTRNKSFNEHLGEVAGRVQDLFEGPHDNTFYDVMQRTIGEKALKPSSGSFLFTLEERRAILAAYEEDNAALKARYFPELGPDEPLFNPPSEKEVLKISEDDKRKAEVDLLARAVYNLANRLTELEKDKA
jgi:hypothetical protein